MKKLTYRKVFQTEDEFFSHKLDQCSFRVYRFLRTKLSRVWPLKEHQVYFFQAEDRHGQASSEMPKGFDYATSQEVDGTITLKYIDIFDFLPKEDVDAFKKKLRHFVISNKRPSFAPAFFEKDEDRITDMGRYFDGCAFASLCAVEFLHNPFLSENGSKVMVSIRNLSSSFALMRYRLFVSKPFSSEVENCLKKEYDPYNDVCKQFGTPWYKPWKFGISYYYGDDARQKAVMSKLSLLKWEFYREIKRYLGMHFADAQLFPPVFFTYSTNIRPNSKCYNADFWNSIGLDYFADYSQKYNLCICSVQDKNDRTGMELLALCGGKTVQNEFYPEYAEYYLPDSYSTYLVANAIRQVAEREIVDSNKVISRTIIRGNTSQLLKTRAYVERKLYYCYRFLNEFSGNTLEKDVFTDFVNPGIKNGSISEKRMEGFPSHVKETKTKIVNILKLLNDVAEFEISKTNMAVQRIMIIITILSLIIALLTLLFSNGSLGTIIKSVFSCFISS